MQTVGWKILAGVALTLAMCARAAALGVPLNLTVDSNNKIVVNPVPYADRFNGLDFDVTRLWTNAPGFNFVNFSSGDSVGFEVRGGLRYWDRVTQLVASTAETLTVRQVYPKGPAGLGNSILQISAASVGLQPGFIFDPPPVATADPHLLEYFIENLSAAEGIYAFDLRFVSRGHTTSDWEMLTFNYHPSEGQFDPDDLDNFNKGISALMFAVPEPGTGLLAGICLIGLIACARRNGRQATIEASKLGTKE